MPPDIQNLPNTSETCPVFGLPFEIMSEVFLHCLPDAHTGPDKSDAPLLLGRICREWRDVALTTPILWASLSIHRTDVTGVVLIELWLSRARGYPLSIHINDPDGGDETANQEMIFDTICRHSSQWRDVVLSLPFTTLSRLRLEGPLPVLERLVIGSEASVDEIEPITGFSDAPLLREVHLALDDIGSVKPRTIVLPWAQLTSFTGYLLSIDESLYVLHEASSLVECNFHDCIGGRPDLDILPPLPLITKLRLQGNFQRNVVDLLHYLTLPALESLELRLTKVSDVSEYTEDIDFAMRTLLSFLSRSSPPLREPAVQYPGNPVRRPDLDALLALWQ
ncbi:hypothetical protein C8R44DRAFT_737651 [Mycena epipterygia]|nr:hypothetical protein C8R44DRAFT_737651 [Mycena epipterygia]